MRRWFRTGANIGVIIVLTIVLVTYATVRWIGGALFEDTYTITVPMPQAGGVFPSQEVTVLGHGVGQVQRAELTPDGVDIVLEIRGDEAVPRSAVVQVLRRSPIGEQSVNFIPVASDYQPPAEVIPYNVPVDEGWRAAPRNSRVEPVAAVVPAEVPFLLEQTERLFSAVDPDDLGTLIHELSEAFGGRADTLKELNRDTLDLNETLVDGIPEFERLLDTSDEVLDTLNAHSESLAESFENFADLSDALGDNRANLDRIITDGSRALEEADLLIVNTQANVACLFDDLTALNRRLAQPHNLEDLAQLLEENEFFYRGFDISNQFDPTRPSVTWARVNLLLFEPAGGQPYVPHRPTPATLPGAACISPFGTGVNAVRQVDAQPPDSTAPGIFYAALVDEDGRPIRGTAHTDADGGRPDRGGMGDSSTSGGSSGGASTGSSGTSGGSSTGDSSGGDDPTGGAPGTTGSGAPDGDTPRTGGGPAAAIAPLLLAGMLVISRRRR